MPNDAEGRPTPADVRAKQDAVYREYRTELTNYAKSLGSPQPADIAHAAFTRLFARWDKTDTTRPLRAWLYNTVRGLVADELRADGRERLYEPTAFDDTIEDENMEPDEAVIANERSWRVRAAVSSLRPRARRIVLLTHVAGLTPKEVAARVGITADAVRATLRRTYPKLADQLKDLLRAILPLVAFSWLARLLKHPAAAPATKLTVAGAVMLTVGAGVISGPYDTDPVLITPPERAPTSGEPAIPPPGTTPAHPAEPEGTTVPRPPAPSGPTRVPPATTTSLPIRPGATVNPDTGPGTKESDEATADTPFGPAELGGDVSTSGSVEDEPCLKGMDECAHTGDSALTGS